MIILASMLCIVPQFCTFEEADGDEITYVSELLRQKAGRFEHSVEVLRTNAAGASGAGPECQQEV